jgi:hypothetical protein
MAKPADPNVSRRDAYAQASKPFGAEWMQVTMRDGMDIRALGIAPDPHDVTKPFGAAEVRLVNGIDYVARPDLRRDAPKEPKD